MGCGPESQVRNRLRAGGNGIRTLGPPRERVGLARIRIRARKGEPGSLEELYRSYGDRGQESSACRSDEFKIGGSEKFGPRSGYRAFCLASLIASASASRCR